MGRCSWIVVVVVACSGCGLLSGLDHLSVDGGGDDAGDAGDAGDSAADVVTDVTADAKDALSEVGIGDVTTSPCGTQACPGVAPCCENAGSVNYGKCEPMSSCQ